jgi:hypothetical protein
VVKLLLCEGVNRAVFHDATIASRRWFVRRGRLGLFMTFNTTPGENVQAGRRS